MTYKHSPYPQTLQDVADAAAEPYARREYNSDDQAGVTETIAQALRSSPELLQQAIPILAEDLANDAFERIRRENYRAGLSRTGGPRIQPDDSHARARMEAVSKRPQDWPLPSPRRARKATQGDE
ncbi:MAG: hypothetical protein M0038_00855 [Pseudomonadota bacterium]|nr:hypothetical protein [Pseudomonadota bacterium]